MSLIDVHAHCQDPKLYKDLKGLVYRAKKEGLAAIINSGTDLDTSRQAVAMAEEEAILWAMVGFHPHEARLWNEHSEPALKKLFSHGKVLGIGEIGLDYHYDFSPKDVQKEVFLKQWNMAAESDLPVMIHIREAFDDYFDIISQVKIPQKVIMHCFSGDMTIARKALDLGFEFSIGGPLTFPKSDETRKIFEFLPDDRIHLETDCPYLAPQAFRGKTNEPFYIIHAFRKLCEIRKTSPVKLSETLIENAHRFFGEKFK